ncbi:RHS repeat-associated core domain-containing protein [uncultured Bacteroides sp.]|uniref:RHS repeat domain-containing protein n=1 Tax=uncultured Bacteroides sp. TaxID=162156 RepID=UPI002AA849D3|nr:RHS repeat-associated core domain-containing protein [uncultured Bacteroides sp.]
MTNLVRNGRTGTSTFGTVDNLSMSYAGNQLIKADDTGTTVTLSASMDFKNNSTAAKEYFYDLNGNLTQDLNKGITGITYNFLNLPQSVVISNTLGQATNTYTYAADGRKLRANIGSKQTDYVGNVIYESVNEGTATLKRILVDGGYIEGGVYYFYLTDHLGNNRVVANASGGIVQTNHYYPFGMSFAEGVATSGQPYKYNGKELDTERGLNLYDYSARLMDPALGRFSTVDPKSEKYYGISPYAYVANNPIKFIDPNGKDIVATTTEAQRMILNTLPQDMRQYVTFDMNGYVNHDRLRNIESNSQNFSSLKTMALSDRILEVKLDDKFTYLDENGDMKTQNMTYLGVDADFVGNDNGKGVGTSTGETGFLGKTLFPDKKGLQNSTNNNVVVIVNSNLSEEGKAQTYSHEANGHALIYISTDGDRSKASHKYASGGTDLNRYLFYIINKSINETIQNMK